MTSSRRARRVEVARIVPVDASVAFAWVADLRTHPRWIVATRLEGTAGRGPELGDRYTMASGPGARRAPGSGLGRLVVMDSMVVEQLERPSTAAARVGRTRLRKLGPVLLGDAGFDVVPLDERRCRVVWWEEAYLAGPLPRAVTDPLVGLALRGFMQLSLGRLAQALARRS
ncbi:SRPBCC family protein [Krasilnikoviella flava]|uniref:Polyketide cyclase / dehydrase and lipid transport n=1 Tax=Krasilnikoviella flava TaxID=526729 RepID=A0A1T5II20_9MICO|nr:SRPBCC family protein [Krasilnikoviella flava]SKC38663.1 Polyketide cyclase / dehydrase and lipid transport [Krasilnikoviella flava]